MQFKDMIGQILELGDEVICKRDNTNRTGSIKSFSSDNEVVQISCWAPSEERYTDFTTSSEFLLKLDNIKIAMPELFI